MTQLLNFEYWAPVEHCSHDSVLPGGKAEFDGVADWVVGLRDAHMHSQLMVPSK